ncbi:MAG: sulfotransferase [Anaerolineae bacterium]
MPSAATTFEETQVSLPIKLVMGAASAMDNLGLPLVNLDVSKLKAKAEQQTGLHDWGDSTFVQDTATLIEFVRKNPNANVLLKMTFRDDIMRRLTNYLKLQEAKKRHPDLTDQPVTKPLVILGLPRTGTTLLQRLLAQDPNSHGPALWELQNPVQVDTLVDSQQQLHKTEAYVKNVRTMSLRLWSIHPTFANQADECYFMLPQSIGENMIYVAMDYFEWFMKRSAVPDYQLHKQYLQALHYNKPQRKWILKSPVHTPKLDDLFTVYPDAQVVFCHRSLGHVIASWASFVAISRKYVDKRVDPIRIARDWMRIWEVSIKEAEKARSKHRPEQFFDVRYDDLTLDSIGTVKKLYNYFGMELSVQAENRMKQWLESDRHKERLGHRYTLDQFGITYSEVEQAFGDYMKKYDLDIE